MRKILPSGFSRYLSNTAWMVSGRFYKMFTTFVVGIFVANYLGPEKFGLMNYVMSFVTLFSVFVVLGLDGILVRELVATPEHRDKILGTAATLKLIGAISSILLIYLILLKSEENKLTSMLILFYAGGFLFQSLYVLRPFFEAKVEAKYAVWAEMTQATICTLLRIAFLLLELPVFWFVFTYFLESVLIGLTMSFFYHQRDRSIFSWSFDKKIGWRLLKSSTPLMLSGIAIIIYQKIDQVMLMKMVDSSEVGYYSVATRFTALVFFIPLLVSRSVMPSLINARKFDYEKYKQRIQYLFDALIWGAFFMAVVLSLVAPFLISTLYSDEYTSVILLLQIVVWKGVFVAMSDTSGQWIVIEHLQKFAPIRNVAGCILNIVLNFLWIPRLGAVGSALATIVSYGLASFLIHLFIKPLRPIFWVQLRTIAFGIPNLFRLVLSFVQRQGRALH